MGNAHLHFQSRKHAAANPKGRPVARTTHPLSNNPKLFARTTEDPNGDAHTRDLLATQRTREWPTHLFYGLLCEPAVDRGSCAAFRALLHAEKALATWGIYSDGIIIFFSAVRDAFSLEWDIPASARPWRARPWAHG